MIHFYPSFGAFSAAVALNEHTHLLIAKFYGYSVMLNASFAW